VREGEVKITANLSKGVLVANGAKFKISCNVRALKDGTRGRAVKEVRRCIPDGLPYDPLPFPKGLWNITAIQWREDYKFDAWEYGPVKIRTDALQPVKVWGLDQDGNYLKETDREAIDRGYLLHYSESNTTLGCIRIANPGDAETITRIIQRIFDSGEKVELEVI
jgi:hypothetical protein